MILTSCPNFCVIPVLESHIYPNICVILLESHVLSQHLCDSIIVHVYWQPIHCWLRFLCKIIKDLRQYQDWFFTHSCQLGHMPLKQTDPRQDDARAKRELFYSHRCICSVPVCPRRYTSYAHYPFYKDHVSTMTRIMGSLSNPAKPEFLLLTLGITTVIQPWIFCLQMAHSFNCFAHEWHDTKCPHGSNALFTFSSRHIFQVIVSAYDSIACCIYAMIFSCLCIGTSYQKSILRAYVNDQCHVP